MQEKMSRLSDREHKILQMITAGMGSKQIAKELGISLSTVTIHRENMAQKLGLRDNAALYRFCISQANNAQA